jgi:pimeloyl-ACP methyl ester carboxylesterase
MKPITRRKMVRALLPLAAIVLPTATGLADEAVGLQRRPVSFQVTNPNENGAVRTIAGYRFDPPCAASSVVVLQHGFSYTKDYWDFPGYSAARALAQAGYAVVAIDRLGYGESELPNGYDVSHEGYAEITRQLVSQLRREFGHVVLGGLSGGAAITMLTQGLFGSADAILVLGYHHRPSDEFLAVFAGQDTPRALQDDYSYFFGTPGHRAEWLHSDGADPEVVRMDTDSAVLTPSGEILTTGKQPSRIVTSNIRVPVFLQIGEQDRLFEPKYADMERLLLSNSPSVTIDVVPGAGHSVVLDRSGPAGTSRLVDWVRGRTEVPSCSTAA